MLKCFLRGLWFIGVPFIPSFYVAAERLPLSIQAGNGTLVLSWPSWARDALLEQASGSLPTPSWRALSPVLYQSNVTHFSYTDSAVESARFFRLRRTGPAVPGLTGYWQLDEASGSVAGDLTGLGGALNTTNTTSAPGRFGAGSIQFNGLEASQGGSLGWVSNANYRVLPPVGYEFSVSVWFSPSTLNSGSRRIMGNDTNGNSGWHLALESAVPGTNYIVLNANSNGTNLVLKSRSLLLPGEWYQLTLTCRSNRARLYLDNALLVEGAGTFVNHQGPLYLGGTPGATGTFAGRIDELRTYTNALSAEQVSLAGWWRFDENAGDIATDSSIQWGLASVTSSNAWVPGKYGSAIDTALGPVIIPNEDFRLLPASGRPFSMSCWVRPRVLPTGRTGLFYCGDGLSRGWQLTVDVDTSGQQRLEVTSTNFGGTLRLRTPVSLPNETWTRIDLTYNGGIATVYINGTKVHSESGAIQASESPLLAGFVPGFQKFNGAMDELKIYRYARADSEIGPVAKPIWEMALMNSSTNLVLPGVGPPGKSLTYSVLLAPSPTRGTITWSPGSPVITYQAGSQKGPDTFAYTVSDGEFTSPPATGVVSVVQPHWLSPTGGVSAPRDGSVPQRAWAAGPAAALDAIWRTNSYYDCFFYAPGEYETTGAMYLRRSTANPGCKHIGSGTEEPATTIRLVDTWSAWGEGTMFSGFHAMARCDGFEVHNMILDCNAQNNPKFAFGEPIWLQVPLANTGLVEQVVLQWHSAQITGNGTWNLGPAAQFDVCARQPVANGYASNCLSLTSTGLTDVINVNANADELWIKLNRKAGEVDFYALSGIQVSGPAVSLPLATSPDGIESRLDAQHSIVMAADQNPGTSWASGPANEVHIMLPLEPGTAVSQVQFQWNCQTLPDLRRLGPAAQYLVFARDPSTGLFTSIPFVTQGRSASGQETATFVDGQSPASIVTDRLQIALMSRETGVDHYSLREVALKNGAATVPLRVPTALNMVASGSSSLLRVFDPDNQTTWSSGTQGAVTGVDVLGSHLKFTRLKVIGFGTKAGRECFPLYLAAPKSGPGVEPTRNVLVEDCLFIQPATNNTDGLSAVLLVAPDSESLQNAVVRRCSVTGVRSHFRYSHAFAAPLVENCFVDDCATAVYFEPEPTGPGVYGFGTIVVRSNLFQNIHEGVAISFHPGSRFDSLVCIGNEMVLLETPRPGHAIAACDTCRPGASQTVTNVTVLNNIVRYRDWLPRPAASHGGLLYSDIQHAVFGNNIIALGTANSLRVRPYPSGTIPDRPPPEDCDNPGLVMQRPATVPPPIEPLPPGYRRAWFNNRDLGGLLLPVRFSSNGTDGLSSQQQWPD